MHDLREQFQHLADDIRGLPRPSAAELRRQAEPRRKAPRGLVPVVGIALGLFSLLVLGQLLSDGGDRLETARPAAPSPASSAPPRAEQAWLPEPWVLVRAEQYAWAAGTESRFRFCGQAMVTTAPTDVAEQVLAHPAGQQAHLVSFTPERDDAIQLFKFSYASCLVAGSAASIAGPRNVWSYGSTAGASEVVGPALHLVEVTGAAGQPGTLADAEDALDLWAQEASRH